MTVEQIEELVFLRLTGGEPSTESSVLRSDIRFLIPDAVNALNMAYYGTVETSEPTGYPNPLFLQVFESVPVALNPVRKKFMAELPVRPLSIPIAKSVVSVGDPDGYDFDFIYPEAGTLGVFNQLTHRDEPAVSVEGMNLVFHNLPASMSNVRVKMQVHINDYSTGSINILVPSGTESQLIDNLYNMYIVQKGNPKNRISNGKEDQ